MIEKEFQRFPPLPPSLSLLPSGPTVGTHRSLKGPSLQKNAFDTLFASTHRESWPALIKRRAHSLDISANVEMFQFDDLFACHKKTQPNHILVLEQNNIQRMDDFCEDA